MDIKELEAKGFEPSQVSQIALAVLRCVKKDFVIMALKQHEEQLNIEITNSKAYYHLNGMDHVDWAYESVDSGECYRLERLIQERNQALSIRCKI